MSKGPGFAWRYFTRQLRSPLAWVVVGVFALAAGGAFVDHLTAFLEASAEALLSPPARPVNVNQLLIRPFLVQAGLAAPLVLPFVTARAQRAGRGLSGVLAPFAGLLAVYGVMLAATLALVLLLAVFGAPEWAPIASGYLGLLLIGAAFLGVALFIASLATSPAPAVIATLAISLAAVAATWLADTAGPDARPLFRAVSVGHALDDFAKGVIDSGHIVTSLTIAALALFLTLQTRPPDRPER